MDRIERDPNRGSGTSRLASEHKSDRETERDE
jgi:hypothetical protein